jgi:hypothetical protein
MATTKIPDNINPSSKNVASLANKDTLSNLKNSVSPKTFGDQAKKAGVAAVVIAATQSTLAKLEKQKANLILEGIKLDKDHEKVLAKIEAKHTPTKQIQNGQTIEVPAELNDSEYQVAVDIENKNYKEAKDNLQKRKDQNQKDIDDIKKDPFKKQKDAKKKRKEKRAKQKTKDKKNKRKSQKSKVNAVLKNAKKSLVPILTLLLTNKIAQVIAQNDKIGKLVADTNAIITEANESGDQAKLDNAKVARDSAIKIIQSNEDKIIKIKKDIEKITIYITIFSIIVSIISSIPIPTAPVPIVISLIIKFIKILDKANRVLLALSALIPLLLASLQKAIDILEDYKTQLLEINGQLELAATNDPNLINNGDGFGTTNDTYKGFKFAIREDNSFGGISVGGFKRHYAVAIDRNNVDVLRSELSFTLDTNDLIEQLKLVIDQQNLIA